MAALGNVIGGLVRNAATSLVNFELAVDPILERLQQVCPPKAELETIIRQKNSITTALTQTQTALNTMVQTGQTVTSIINVTDIAVRVIKNLPLPTSVPPGIGIPINVINRFTDTLIKLSDLIKTNKGIVASIAPAVQSLNSDIQTILNKLAQLDTLLAGCLEGETAGLTDEEKEAYFTSLGINLSALDTTSSPEVNITGGQALEDSLAPNSNNPLVYKDFKFVLENDKENTLSFPRRRIVATRITDAVQIVGNYSFSASTQILVDEVKFQVDKYLNEQLATAAAPNEQLTIVDAPNERTAFTTELL
jgi:hypothetical protein